MPVSPHQGSSRASWADPEPVKIRLKEADERFSVLLREFSPKGGGEASCHVPDVAHTLSQDCAWGAEGQDPGLAVG